MAERILPTAYLTDALRVALSAANTIANPFLIYLIEMAALEADRPSKAKGQ